MNFTITELAAERIKKEAEEKGHDPHLRIGIRGGGCNGFSYIFEWAGSKPREKDHVFELNGAAVYIDPKSMVYLNGTELVFETSFMGHGFKLTNPNVKGSCGCGSSVAF